MTATKTSIRGHGAALLIGISAIQFGGTASAAPMLDLVWSDTTGLGVPGGTFIEAAIGDELTVDVIVTIDATGFAAAGFDLLGTGVTAMSNTLIPGSGGPPECPSPPHLVPGTCLSATFKSFVPLGGGVVDSSSDTTGYAVGGLDPEFTPSTMTVGRGVFEVTADSGSVSTGFTPGVDGVLDGEFIVSIPAVSTVTFSVAETVPEPTTLALLGLALAGLGFGRRCLH